MNVMFLIVFLLIQIGVNYGVNFLMFQVVGLEYSIYSLIAAEMIGTLIISVIYGIMTTPPGYRKEFYKQPGFHKNALTIFVIFSIINIIYVLL